MIYSGSDQDIDSGDYEDISERDSEMEEDGEDGRASKARFFKSN